ncbi:MAG: phytanoyl-CoA dioxygenase family protein [Pseudomonadota bacterium]|nr:phytanoyl-CoA dioxygenase family protein [Pseudomonadota bacterium]
MGKVLTDEQIEQYHREGYLYPLEGVSKERCNGLLAGVERFEEEYGVNPGLFKLKGHLTMRETWDFIREDAILDVAEDLIGPNILAFGSRFWVKPAGDGSFVSWHQDSAYFGCDPHDMVTCWVALTHANIANGCMRAMPQSHREGYDHEESHENAPGDAPGEKKNLLGRGQTIKGLDETKAVHMELEQGQFSIHNERTAHASGPNNTDNVRIGYSFFLIPPHVKSTLERRPATLVRGVDNHGHWDEDPVPTEESMKELIDMMIKHNAQYTNPDFAQNA